jgi:FecR protein
MASLRCTLALALIVGGLCTSAPVAQTSIGNATAAKNRVDGTVGGKIEPISTGTEVYSNEVVRTGPVSLADLKFIDQTTLNVGPASEITLDKFIYDPTGRTGSVVIQATRGAFRFVTGTQDKRAYEIKTPYGSLGVRGTILEIVLMGCPQSRPEDCGLKVKLVEGGATVTTLAGQVIEMNDPNTVVTVAANGAAQGPADSDDSILQFANANDALTTAGLGGGGGAGGQTTPLGAAGGVFSTPSTLFAGGITNSFNDQNQPGSSGPVGFTTPTNFVTPGVASSVSPSK